MKLKLLLGIALFILCVNIVSAQHLVVTFMSQQPDPAEPGKYVELRWKVENYGSEPAKDVIFELLPEYPFSLEPGQDPAKYISKITGADDYGFTLYYKVRVDENAVEGANEIKLRYKIGRENWITLAPFEILVSARKNIEITSVIPTILEPGKETNLIFTLTNIGNSPLRNIVFSWEEADGSILPLGSDNTKRISTLDIGRSVKLNFKAVADTSAVGLYLLTPTMKYELGNGTETVTSEIGIVVGGETDFDVVMQEATDSTISISLANIGVNTAYSVTVRIPEQENFRVIGPTASIIGNLNQGDYTIVTFQIIPLGKEKNLIIEISYTDTTGTRQTVTKEIKLSRTNYLSTAEESAMQENAPGKYRARSEEQPSFFESSTFIGIIVVIVIVGAGLFIYRKIKKRRRK